MRRADLADFLRARRNAIAPEDVGLVAGARRRSPGLRREEVAQIAGVSASWYTWLEQGRERARASVDVIDALARALRLDPVEHDHLRVLAGHAPNRGVPDRPHEASPGVEALLGAFAPSPAYALTPDWDFLAWNDSFARLYPNIETLAEADRNLVWVVFAEPSLRTLIGSWETEARRVLSQFRAEVSGLHDLPHVDDLVLRLHDASDEFREWWPRYDVAAFETHRRTFHHPLAGELRFLQQQLVPADDPRVRIVVHLPIDDDDSTQRLARM